MFNNLSLAKKIYIALTIFGAVILITTISIFYIDEQELAEELVKDNIEATAQSYFDTVNTMMLTGTMANRKIFQDKILAQGDIVEARIIRAPKVVELFGAGFGNQKPQDGLDQIGLQGEKKFQLVEKDGKRLMQFVLPMLAKSNYRGTDCLACHQASENEILGVVKISYDLTRVDEQIISSLTKASMFQLIIMIISFVALGYIIFKLVISRLKQLEITINDVERDLDFSKEITIHRHDELGAVIRAFNKMIHKFRTSFITVSNASNHLINSAEQVNEIADLTKEAVLIQKNGTDSVATAINELDASASEVENNTKLAAEKSVLAEQKAQQGMLLASNAREGIDQLSDQVSNNMGLINELNEKISEVGSVLDVITSIADQTNLLALNAAIEAARAGEQGRGFAVVADEVRSLANRTQESIEQIQKTIDGLQSDANNVVSSMTTVTEQAKKRAMDVADVSVLLEDINVQIKELDDLNCQIATAAKQQNLAADEVNINVVNISEVAEQSSDDAIKGKQISEHLLSLSQDLEQQVKLFKL